MKQNTAFMVIMGSVVVALCLGINKWYGDQWVPDRYLAVWENITQAAAPEATGAGDREDAEM